MPNRSQHLIEAFLVAQLFLFGMFFSSEYVHNIIILYVLNQAWYPSILLITQYNQTYAIWREVGTTK